MTGLAKAIITKSNSTTKEIVMNYRTLMTLTSLGLLAACASEKQAMRPAPSEIQAIRPARPIEAPNPVKEEEERLRQQEEARIRREAKLAELRRKCQGYGHQEDNDLAACIQKETLAADEAARAQKELDRLAQERREREAWERRKFEEQQRQEQRERDRLAQERRDRDAWERRQIEEQKRRELDEAKRREGQARQSENSSPSKTTNTTNDRMISGIILKSSNMEITSCSMYENANYTGSMITLKQNEKRESISDFNDKTSSIRINSKCKLIAFDQFFFKGAKWEFTRDTATLSPESNDKISSAVCECR
jgi:hypothetical protein